MKTSSASIEEAKSRTAYSEEEYVNHYLSQNLVEKEWDKETFAYTLRKWYKVMIYWAAEDIQNGETYTDYVAKEIETAPITEVYFADFLVFAYFGKTHKLRTINDTVIVNNVPEGKQLDATAMARTLYSSYGFICVDYDQLVNEYENIVYGDLF